MSSINEVTPEELPHSMATAANEFVASNPSVFYQDEPDVIDVEEQLEEAPSEPVPHVLNPFSCNFEELIALHQEAPTDTTPMSKPSFNNLQHETSTDQAPDNNALCKRQYQKPISKKKQRIQRLMLNAAAAKFQLDLLKKEGPSFHHQTFLRREAANESRELTFANLLKTELICLHNPNIFNCKKLLNSVVQLEPLTFDAMVKNRASADSLNYFLVWNKQSRMSKLGTHKHNKPITKVTVPVETQNTNKPITKVTVPVETQITVAKDMKTHIQAKLSLLVQGQRYVGANLPCYINSKELKEEGRSVTPEERTQVSENLNSVSKESKVLLKDLKFEKVVKVGNRIIPTSEILAQLHMKEQNIQNAPLSPFSDSNDISSSNNSASCGQSDGGNSNNEVPRLRIRKDLFASFSPSKGNPQFSFPHVIYDSNNVAGHVTGTRENSSPAMTLKLCPLINQLKSKLSGQASSLTANKVISNHDAVLNSKFPASVSNNLSSSKENQPKQFQSSNIQPSSKTGPWRISVDAEDSESTASEPIVNNSGKRPEILNNRRKSSNKTSPHELADGKSAEKDSPASASIRSRSGSVASEKSKCNESKSAEVEEVSFSKSSDVPDLGISNSSDVGNDGESGTKNEERSPASPKRRSRSGSGSMTSKDCENGSNSMEVEETSMSRSSDTPNIVKSKSPVLQNTDTSESHNEKELKESGPQTTNAQRSMSTENQVISSKVNPCKRSKSSDDVDNVTSWKRSKPSEAEKISTAIFDITSSSLPKSVMEDVLSVDGTFDLEISKEGVTPWRNIRTLSGKEVQKRCGSLIQQVFGPENVTDTFDMNANMFSSVVTSNFKSTSEGLSSSLDSVSTGKLNQRYQKLEASFIRLQVELFDVVKNVPVCEMFGEYHLDGNLDSETSDDEIVKNKSADLKVINVSKRAAKKISCSPKKRRKSSKIPAGASIQGDDCSVALHNLQEEKNYTLKNLTLSSRKSWNSTSAVETSGNSGIEPLPVLRHLGKPVVDEKLSVKEPFIKVLRLNYEEVKDGISVFDLGRIPSTTSCSISGNRRKQGKPRKYDFNINKTKGVKSTSQLVSDLHFMVRNPKKRIN
ncbi:uncharacterized protein [Bemisia tabaci]|uniref:uncharacterized protein isoform X1 n=1 Tax=Bemisia tabaci TaxID=7038 RepID=UPI003B27E33F